MRAKHVLQLLQFYIENRMSAMLVGMPGIGKTDLITAAAVAAGADLLVVHPVTADPTDAKGLPFPNADGKSADFLPYGDLLRMMKAEKLLVVFLDDLGQAPPAVQASFMQLLLARQINGHKIPDCVVFMAATNRRSDRAGVSGILEPVKSRFNAILHLDANLDDWKDWAALNNVPPELVGFLNFKTNLLAEAWKASQDIEAQPCPRTWAFVANILKKKIPSAQLEAFAVEGAVGSAAAGELTAFLRMYRNLPDPEKIIANPDAAEIPDDPATIYAIATTLAMRADVNNFAKIGRYAERMAAHDKGEVAVLLVRDAIRLNRKLMETKAFTHLTTTKIGELFRGDQNS